MNRTGLKIALTIGFAVGLICAVDPQLDLDISASFFHRGAAAVRGQCPALGAAHARSGAFDHHASCAAGISRRYRQADLAAAAHADRRPRRAVPHRDAGARPRPSHQPHSQGSLGPGAADRRAAIRRRLSVHAVVGSARRMSEQLLVHRRRAVRRVLDAGARGAGAGRNCSRSPMARRSPSAPASACCASPPARIFSPTSFSPACSCIC